MNLQTPTTKDISDNIIAQLQAELNQVIPLAPKSFMRVLAKVLAGVFILLFKYGGWMSLQMFVSKAGIETTTVNGVQVSPLTEWGRLVGTGDPIAATQAEHGIAINVTTQGGTLPSGTQLVGANNGVTYILIAPVALNATPVAGTVRAVSDQAGGDGAGTIGNLEFTDIMSFANPLGQVERDADVTGKVTIGADAETTSSYRQRILDRFQKRPQGGAYSDYELWGETVAGIANIYPYTGAPGQVTVYVEAESTLNGIPTAGQLADVEEAIELDAAGLASRRPIGSLVTAAAITRLEFMVDVAGLVVDNETQVKGNLEDALLAFFLTREPFITGLTPLPRKDRITLSSVTSIVEDIVSAAGGIVGVVELAPFMGSATTLISLGEGEKAKLELLSYS